MTNGPSTGRPVELCPDDELGYLRGRTRFDNGAGLALDEAYRLAHLPLVAPKHPRVIPERDGSLYRMGRHPRVYSAVLPIPTGALDASETYRQLDRELRASRFGAKIAWELLPARADKLHATLCGELGDGAPPVVAPDVRETLARLGPITVELRGLFSGTVNHGRLYIRAYPERRGGTNLFGAVQSAFGRRASDLYLVGVWNLTDDLDPDEAASLRKMIERWWERPLLRFEVDRLWILGSSDDLVLDSEVSEILPLTAELPAAFEA